MDGMKKKDSGPNAVPFTFLCSGTMCMRYLSELEAGGEKSSINKLVSLQLKFCQKRMREINKAWKEKF